jgi:phage gpG-like protein
MSNATAYHELANVLARLDKAASGKLAYEIRLAIARETKALIWQGFVSENGPSGEPWALRKAGGPLPVLARTGALKRSWSVVATHFGILARSALDYSGYHQAGTQKMVARKMVPDGDVPRYWITAWTRVAKQVIDRVLGT